MRKVCIIGPAWVGDMVMAQTLFMLLKQRDPDIMIDVLAPPWSAPLLKRMPEVSSFIEMPMTHGELKLRERYNFGKKLREKHYDQAIILPNSFKSALIPWWADIPLRTGWARELRGVLLNDVRRLNKKRYPLMIERFMALGLRAMDTIIPKPYPIPRLQMMVTSQEAVLTKYHLEMKYPVLALCPGAEFGPAKRWPEEYFARVAEAKLNEGWQVWLMGSIKDQTVTMEIMKQTAGRCVNLAGRTTLEEAIDLLSLSTCVVSNDSGLMHVAAALDKPLIALYGPTSPDFTPPLSDKANVFMLSKKCQPCFQRTCPFGHHQCMRDLSFDTVIDAIH